MGYVKSFLHAGHAPTLFAAFLYFSFSCCIWVLNGAMAPFNAESYALSPAQIGLMLAIPSVAGASVALSLGSGWFPPRHKGLAMGLVGVGTAVSVLVAPPLALGFGWQAVYGLAAIAVALPLVVMTVEAHRPIVMGSEV